MENQLEKLASNLINKIFAAHSQEEVNELIDVAMKVLKHNKTEKYFIILFINTIVAQLELFNPMKKTAQQWSNISMAKILINRLQRGLEV